MSDQNRTLSRRWFMEVWNERRTATIEELMSPDGVAPMESGDLRGVGAFKQFRDEFVAALPDLKFKIEGIVSDGDDVVVRWRAAGTQVRNRDHDPRGRIAQFHRSDRREPSLPAVMGNAEIPTRER